MPSRDSQAIASTAHSSRKKWPISGSAQDGENSWPNAVTRVTKSSPNDTITNQCAAATIGSRDIRVWPRNSLTRVIVRRPGRSVRVGSGRPRAKVDRNRITAWTNSATPVAVTARHSDDRGNLHGPGLY